MTVKDFEKKIKGKFKLEDGFSTTNLAHSEAKNPSVKLNEQQYSNTDVQLNVPQQPQHRLTDEKFSEQKFSLRAAKPAYARKMTIYLTEDLFKAFNDIYATRLLRGCPTEKSTLVCEAMNLLIEEERRQGHIHF